MEFSKTTPSTSDKTYDMKEVREQEQQSSANIKVESVPCINTLHSGDSTIPVGRGQSGY